MRRTWSGVVRHDSTTIIAVRHLSDAENVYGVLRALEEKLREHDEECKGHARRFRGKRSRAGQHSPAGSTSTHDAALSNWLKSSEHLFKRLVQSQIELCHFFGSRWE